MEQPTLLEVSVHEENDYSTTNTLRLKELLESKGLRVLESMVATRLYIVVNEEKETQEEWAKRIGRMLADAQEGKVI